MNANLTYPENYNGDHVPHHYRVRHAARRCSASRSYFLTGASSPTALIPAIFGVLLLGLGFLAPL